MSKKILLIVVTLLFVNILSVAAYTPKFSGGHSQAFNICEDYGATSINTLIAVFDSSTGLTDTWSVLVAPVHGTLVATYSTVSADGLLIPTGLTYTSGGGYSGNDSFKVRVANSSGADTTTVYVTVNPLPSIISGTLSVCAGMSTSLSDVVSGGTWASSNLPVAQVGSVTGLVTGVAAGTASIFYTTAGGCIVTATVTANASPSAINGNLQACIGFPAALTDAVTGGVWTSSATGVATIGSGTGIVAGSATGTAGITYTLLGCYAAKIVTVSIPPSGISGTFSLCQAVSTTLSDVSTGGRWASSNSAIGSIGSTSGILTGVSGGTITISYSLVSTGCYSLITATINPIVTGVIAGPSIICVGHPTSFSDAVTGGTWSMSNADAAVSSAGVVTGTIAGTDTLMYSVTGTCGAGMAVSQVIITTTPYAGTVTGPSSVCSGSAISFSSSIAGGRWGSTNPSVGTIDSLTGIFTGVSAGVVVVTYAMALSCGTAIASATVTVNASPAFISGISSVCTGLSYALSDALTGGTWASTAPTVAVIGLTTGTLNSIAAGTTIIIYTASDGCFVNSVVNVAVSPHVISGALGVCIGATDALSDITTGGVWSSTATAIATVGSTGIVHGVASGTSVISYAIGSCAATGIATVNPQPLPISGTLSICRTFTSSLSDATSGGVWFSSNPTVLGVGTGGAITGSTVGTSLVSYSIGGCAATTVVTVNAQPTAIGGSAVACIGAPITLTDGVSGGAWSSSNTLIASVSAGTGSDTAVVSGMANGGVTISYIALGGCTVTKAVSVNLFPSAISGTPVVCIGGVTELTDATTGGLWSSSNTTVAGVAGGGVVGVAAGTAIISYSINSCAAAVIATINATPAAITGTLGACTGLSTYLSDATTGGLWTSSNTVVATVGSGSGIVNGNAAGTSRITYTTTGGCYITAVVSIGIDLSAIHGTNVFCSGLSAVLSDTVAGGTWATSDASVASIGSLTGLVTGIANGTATITYAKGTECYVTLPVVVNTVPSVALITGDSVACVDSTIVLQDGTAGGIWSSSNVFDLINNHGIVLGLAPGIDTVMYTVTNSCGTRSVAYIVTVNYCRNTTEVAPSGSSTAAGEVSVYPNPATSMLYINAPGKVNVSICSMEGKALLYKKDAENIDISQLAEGLYLVQLFDENGRLLAVKKMVKER